MVNDKTLSKIDKELEEELDKQFPKGDKARGKALVLFAIANIKINKLKQELENGKSKI
jgi:hypothetical protein